MNLLFSCLSSTAGAKERDCKRQVWLAKIKRSEKKGLRKMTKEELKALGVPDDVADKIVEDYGKNYVSKAQFNTKLEELKAAKAEKEAMVKEVDGLKKANKDNEALAAQIDEMKKAAKEREKQYQDSMNQFKLDSAVEMALTTAKARNPKAVRSLLDGGKLKLNEDGTVSGLDEQIKAIKESDAYMFEDGTVKAGGIEPGNPGGKDDAGTEDEANIAKEFGAALGL